MTRKITYLRGVPCADGIKCPAVLDVEGEEDLQVIYPNALRDLLGLDEPSQEMRTLLADRIGPGESLGRAARSRLPEVT